MLSHYLQHPALNFYQIAGACDLRKIQRAHMRVNFCGFRTFVAQQFLYVAQVGAVFEQMCGKRMPQRVHRAPRADTGHICLIPDSSCMADAAKPQKHFNPAPPLKLSD